MYRKLCTSVCTLGELCRWPEAIYSAQTFPISLLVDLSTGCSDVLFECDQECRIMSTLI